MRTANWTAGVLNLLAAVTLGAPAVALAGSVTYTALINGGPGGIDLFLQDDNTGQVNFMMLDSQITLPDPVCTSVSNQFSCVQNLSGTLLVGNGSRDYSLPFPIGHDIQEVSWDYNGSGGGTIHYFRSVTGNVEFDFTGQIVAVGGLPEPSSWALCALGLVGLALLARRRGVHYGTSSTGIQPQ